MLGAAVDEAGQTLDEVLCTYALAPRSFTGEDTAELAQGDEVEIVRSPRSARIAFLPDHNDYLALSRKLGWGGKMG